MHRIVTTSALALVLTLSLGCLRRRRPPYLCRLPLAGSRPGGTPLPAAA